MELKKREKEKFEKEQAEREAAEALARQIKQEAEMVMRTAHLLETSNTILHYDKIVFEHHQHQKGLREWKVFAACRNLPDFKLNQINSYLTNWEVNLESPTLEIVFRLSPEILQLIEELQEFLLLPQETVSTDTIYEIGLSYHRLKEKQQMYIDQSTDEVIQDLTEYFDPEQGIFNMCEHIGPITFAMYGNIFAQPDLVGHSFERLKFKFKIPENLVERKGVFRLLKTEYDHYSDSSNSFFAPGVDNALRRSVQDWESKKVENLVKTSDFKSEEPIIGEAKIVTKKAVRDGERSGQNGSKERNSVAQKMSAGADVNSDDEEDLDQLYRKLARDLARISWKKRIKEKKLRNRNKIMREVPDASKTEDERFSTQDKDKAGDGAGQKTEDPFVRALRTTPEDRKIQEERQSRPGKQEESGKLETKDGSTVNTDDGMQKKGSDSDSGDDEKRGKSKSSSRGRSKEKNKEDGGSKSASKSKSGSRGRSKSRKSGEKSQSSSKKGKKVKKRSKSKERQKTEAELAKERERAEKAQFIPPLEPHELNLRNYTILGGVYHFNWLETPYQPKHRGYWILHQMEARDQTLQEIPFEADFVPPTPHDMQEAKKTPEEMEREAKRQEEELQKIVALEMNVPQTALWFEPPIPVRWDSKRRIWSSDGFYDIRFNEDQLYLCFRTTQFGIIGFGHNRFSNLPYQSFELKPGGRNKCVFSLMAAMAAIEFTIVEDLICVSSLQNVSNSEVVEAAMMNKYLRPRQLIKALRYHGLDVFPELDSYAYVDGVLLKHIETEEHLYQCMAVLAPAYNFHWSRWNLLAGRERMVFQMRERLGTTTPANYQMVLSVPLKCSLIQCTEVSPNFSDEPVENCEFHADLLHLATSVSSGEALDVIKGASAHFIETVRTLVTAVRPISFS